MQLCKFSYGSTSALEILQTIHKNDVIVKIQVGDNVSKNGIDKNIETNREAT